MANCTGCGRQIFEWEMHYYSSYAVCSDCYRRRYGADGKRLICTMCRMRISDKEAVRKLGKTTCKKCYKKEMERRNEWVCASCKRELKINEKKFKTPDGKTLCMECARKNSTTFRLGAAAKGKCTKCGSRLRVGLAVDERTVLCKRCAIIHIREQDKKAKKGNGIVGKLKHLFEKE
ncbi:MAG: hypothetical protein ABIG39_00500 [Candidatus Micrarchaeota archaeon]